MKLSTKGRYGVLAMYDLAVNYKKDHVSIKEIAKRQDISEHYLEQLMGTLRRAGFVSSTRGPSGGYKLARRPSEITVGDIIRIMEGPIAPVDCLLYGQESTNYCKKANKCITRDIWDKVGQSISNVLNNITLEDLLKEFKGSEDNA